MKRFVQVYKRTVRVDRVPRGKEPVIEMELAANERIVQIEERLNTDVLGGFGRRKTVDYSFDVWVEWSAEVEA